MMTSRNPAPNQTNGLQSNGLIKQKIRVTILCARSLAKRDLFRLPDPFVRICVESTGAQSGEVQVHSTESAKNTVDPKWNQHYDLYIGCNDAITISVWNEKKSQNKTQLSSGAFLGCIRLLSNAIDRLKDTGITLSSKKSSSYF